MRLELGGLKVDKSPSKLALIDSAQGGAKVLRMWKHPTLLELSLHSFPLQLRSFKRHIKSHFPSQILQRVEIQILWLKKLKTRR